MARTILTLIERRASLLPFSTFHFGGHWDADGMQMAAATCRVVRLHGGPPRQHRFPWMFVYAAAPIVTTLREMLEMRYL